MHTIPASANGSGIDRRINYIYTQTLRTHNKSLSMRSSHWNCPKHLNESALGENTKVCSMVATRNEVRCAHIYIYIYSRWTGFFFGVSMCVFCKSQSIVRAVKVAHHNAKYVWYVVRRIMWTKKLLSFFILCRTSCLVKKHVGWAGPAGHNIWFEGSPNLFRVHIRW